MTRKVKSVKDLQEMSFCDDVFMNVALDNNVEVIQVILRILLKDPAIQVSSCKTQRRISSFEKDIYMDIYVRDEKERIYDIEIQNQYPDDLPQRMRYYQGRIDSNHLYSGTKYIHMKPTYIFFLLHEDRFSKKSPIHDIVIVDHESDEHFVTGAHWVLANMDHAFDDTDSDLYRLFHDLKCTKASDMYFDCFRETMAYYKSTEEGKNRMEKYMNSSYYLGVEDGVQNEKKQYIQRMLNKKLSLEDIADYSNMNVNELKQFIKENNLH